MSGRGTYLVVGHPVVVEVRGSSEAFATCGALMGFLSGVYPSVGVKTGGGGEGFTTHVTRVRFLT